MIIEWIYIIALLFIISLYQYNLSLPILIIIFILIYSHLKPSLQINEGFEKSYMGFPAGYFKIRSRLNGKCLDVNGGNTASGSRIVLWDCHDGLHQQWYTDNLGRLKNRLSNRCLDVIDAQQSNGTAVQIWDCLGGTNQQWYVDAVGHIKTKMNNSNLTFNDKEPSPLAPVYIWSDNNTESQRWYFESVEKPQQILRLATNFDGLHDQQLQIPNAKLYPSNNYTYYFWIKMTDLQYKNGQWKHLLHKGSPDTNIRSPGIWIYPTEPKFHFRSSTTNNSNEGCDPEYVIAANEWIHVAYVLEENTISAYINAQLIRKCVLQGAPNTNDGNLYIGMNGFGGQMKNIEYGNYSMTKEEIANRMNETQPEQKCRQNLPVTIVPNNLLKNSDLKTGWQAINLDNVVFNEVCPPNGMGGNTVTFTLKPDQSYYYSTIDNAILRPEISYRISLWIKNDEPNTLNVRVYTGSNEQIQDGVSRIFTGYQSVNRKDNWKQLNWIFRNRANSKAQRVSFMFNYENTPQGRVSLFMPTLIEAGQQSAVPQNVIKNVKYSSDDSWPPGAETNESCKPENAELNNEKGWCAAQPLPLKNYLQLDFGEIYQLTQIITQGRGDYDQWVTTYVIYYKDVNNQWVKSQEFKGNADRNTFQVNNLTIDTSALRIYPLTWSGHPSMRVGLIGQLKPKQNDIKIAKLSSNGSYPKNQPVDSNCRPENATINGSQSWCAAESVGSQYYLQADFDNIYKVEKISTQGRPTVDQWVTEYSIYYKLPYTNHWKKFGDVFPGNFDRNTIRTNSLGIITQGIRVYPTRWVGWPSIRIGFEGLPQKLDKCEEYKNRSLYAETDTEKKKYTDLFNQECHKISYANHLKELQAEKEAYIRLFEKYKELKASGDLSNNQIISLEKKIKDLQLQLQRAHFEVELSKAKKCPPQEKCLPYVDYNQCPPSKTINDFDIKTHKDFYKYNGKLESNQLEEENKKLQKQLSDLGSELEKCQKEFNLTNNIVNCQKMPTHSCEPFTDLQTITVCQLPPTPIAHSNHKYDITKHKDFQKIMATMMLKSNCAVPKEQLIHYITLDDCNKRPIEKHPQYPLLMKKCSIPSERKELKDYPINQHPDFNKAVKQIIQSLPIEKHPQYQSLMSKYAIRDTTTCPPTYKPCNLRNGNNGKIVTQAGEQVVYQSLDGQTLYKLNNQGYLVKVINGKEIQLEGVPPKTNINDFDITTHKDYPKVLEKYALRDNTTCPATYKPCKKLSEYEIAQHPDINKYVLKTQLPKSITPNEEELLKQCRHHFRI